LQKGDKRPLSLTLDDKIHVPVFKQGQGSRTGMTAPHQDGNIKAFLDGPGAGKDLPIIRRKK
jgi:hypothetical protein